MLARSGLYRKLLDIAIAYESADWEKVNTLVEVMGIKNEQVPALYVSALDWSSALRRGIHDHVAG